MVRGWKRTVHHSEIFIRTGKSLSDDDLRAVYGDISARQKEAFLIEILKGYKEHHKTDCPPGEAEKILATGKSNGKAKIFWYDKPSDTWRGAKWRDVVPTPRWLSVTKKQEAFSASLMSCHQSHTTLRIPESMHFPSTDSHFSHSL